MRSERVFVSSNVKIMAGGRAITRAFSEKIEADGFAMLRDLHDIGQNLVCMMLEGAGFEVHNLRSEIGVQERKNLLGGLRRPAHYSKSTMRACIVR